MSKYKPAGDQETDIAGFAWARKKVILSSGIDPLTGRYHCPAFYGE
jgi:hypothetical protein